MIEVIKLAMIPLWGGLGMYWCNVMYPNGAAPWMIIGGLAFGAPFAIGMFWSLAYIDEHWGSR